MSDDDYINIFVMKDDRVHDLIHAFLQELHAREYIYIPNGSTGWNLTNAINKILFDNHVIKKGGDDYVPGMAEVLFGGDEK